MASIDLQPSHWYISDLDRILRFHNQGLIIVAIVVISVILVITFFFFNFLRHCRQIFAIQGSASLSFGTGAVAAAVQNQSKGLDEATINSLPIFFHSSLPGSEAAFRESECSICLGSFEENETIKVIPKCMHVYHSECVDKWLLKKAICPLCRATLDSSTTLELSA